MAKKTGAEPQSEQQDQGHQDQQDQQGQQGQHDQGHQQPSGDLQDESGGASQAESVLVGGRRVVCEVVRRDVDGRECPMRDPVIDGVMFATVSIGGCDTHVSERIAAEKIQRFLGFPGYRVFKDGDDYDRLIEDAIDRARAATPTGGLSSAERSYLDQLEEQRSINLAQADELRRKDVIIRDQADEIHRLKGELARLREETGRK